MYLYVCLNEKCGEGEGTGEECGDGEGAVSEALSDTLRYINLTGLTTSHVHWVARGTGTPKDKDEVNRRDVCECDG